MTWQTIRHSFTVAYPQMTLTGDIEYDPAQHALAHVNADTGEEEVLTVNLFDAGYVAAPGEAFIKDWSEHAGFAQALDDACVVEIIEAVTVGPFRQTAHRVRVLA
ncbi:MAG: hypothetical protein ACTH0V_00375 [Microbacteriaceae bacterium]